MRFTIRDDSSNLQNLDGIVVFVFDDMSTERLDTSIAKKLLDIRSRNIFHGKSGEVYTTLINSGTFSNVFKVIYNNKYYAIKNEITSNLLKHEHKIYKELKTVNNISK